MAANSDLSPTGANLVAMFVNHGAALDEPEVDSNIVTAK
jgi:hypothetical protein